MQTELARNLCEGKAPRDDGWGWLYSLFDSIAPINSVLRKISCCYFFPSKLEIAGDGFIYRFFGVPQFGQIIPTGGITIRRMTGARMAPYTLSGTSIKAAREFYHRTCVFEFLHLPFFITLLVLAVQRAHIGRIDWAVEDSVINLIVNLYPIMHHRNTRRRIVALLSKAQSRRR